MDSIVQEEVESCGVRGVFDTLADAYRFLDWYAEQYSVEDTSHLELYAAELELEGHGRKHFMNEENESDLPEQVDFDTFRTGSAEDR